MSKRKRQEIAVTQLPDPSIEQKQILEDLKTQNVIVTAVAGAGKTTLAMHVCQKFESKNVLIITYNRALKESSQERVDELGFGNRVSVKTYHGLMASVTKELCFDDVMFRNLLSANMSEFQVPDIVIIDEMQDQRKPHFLFLKNLFNQHDLSNIKFLCVGDVGQQIYNFYAHDSSDSRFLLQADKLFNKWTQQPFIHRKLSVSYRTTKHPATFVNYITREEKNRTPITAGNTCNENPVNYIIDKPGSMAVKCAIQQDIKEFGAENVMLLAHSTNYHYMKDLVNSLIKSGVKFYVSEKSNKSSQTRLLKGKVLVQTFCGAKGLERKCVYVFSMSYQKFYFQETCPNQIYVALTRSKEKLNIVQDCTMPCCFGSLFDLKFQLGNAIKIHYNRAYKPRTKKPDRRSTITTFSVTQLCEFVETGLLMQAAEFLTCETLLSPIGCDLGEQKTSAQFGSTAENISPIIGVALPFMVEKLLTKQNVGINLVLDPILAYSRKELTTLVEKHGEKALLQSTYKKTFPPYKIQRIRQLNNAETNTPQEYCELATANISYCNFHHLLKQITHFKWVKEDVFGECVSRFIQLIQPKVLANTPRFEEQCIGTASDGQVNIVGYADLLIALEVFEFKWTSKLSIDHLLQCALYMVLSGSDCGYLYNFKHHELVKITCPPSKRKKFLEFVVQCKQATPDVISDEEFFKGII